MGKRKDIIHAPKKCGGILNVEYTDDNIPYLKCGNCQFVLNDWIKWDQEYKTLWESKLSWSQKKNHLTCLLGYFCARYFDYYQVEYTMSLSEKGLFRGPEMNILRRVYNMFKSDPWSVKNYIDYIFQVKIHKRKKRVTSLSFLAVADIVQEFKLVSKRAEKVDRDTPLPSKMIEWVTEFSPEIFEILSLSDFGDLNLLLTYYKKGHLENNKAVDRFISKLQHMKYVTKSLDIKNWRNNA